LVPLHVLHKPPEVASAQAVLQHTPSVQNPLWHWPAAVHAKPFPFKPQELFTQVSGGLQSVSFVQMFRQAFALELHTKLPQGILAGVLQVPLPSQVEPGMAKDVLAQTGSLQGEPWS
jgi:hypothetical protein